MSIQQTIDQRSEKQGLLLQQLGFKDTVHVAKSLQGNIWRATAPKTTTGNAQKVVVKMADKGLHNNGIAHVKGQYYQVHEDIVAEGKILELVTSSTDCPNSIVKFSGLFESESDICLAMEDGGNSLFNFILKCHKMLKNGMIEYSHWMKVVHLIFKQMIECVEYIHSKNVCHFDISLENFLINDVSMIVIESDSNGNAKKAKFALDQLQVKLCDFGLAEQIAAGSQSTKWCGKSNYKAPEVIAQKKFDPESNDIWCLGICLFTAAFGSNPWEKACPSKVLYQCIVQQNLMVAVLQKWGLAQYATTDLIELLMAIFQAEDQRISIQGIKQTAWYNQQ